MTSMKKLLVFIIFFFSYSAAHAQFYVLQGPQGGTGIGSTAVGNIGNCLKVSTVSPLVWTIGTCGSGGGGGSGTWATTTSLTAGQLLNYPLNATDIVMIGSTSATSSASFYFDPNQPLAVFVSPFIVNSASSTIRNLSVSNATTTNLLSTASTTLYNATTTSLAVFNIASTTNLVASTGATTTNLYIPGQTRIASLSGLSLMTTGVVSAYGGASCTNQFPRSLDANGAPTCASVANTDLVSSTISGVSLGGTLASLTATNGSLTFSGAYTGASAQTAGLNLANQNNWTANINTTGSLMASSSLLINAASSTILNLSVINATTTSLLVTASTTLTQATSTFLSSRNFSVTGTATSTFTGGIATVKTLDVQSTSASSTFQNGLNISNGCFAVNGVCVGGGGGSGTVTSVTLATPNSTLTLGGTNPVTTSGTINADINLANANTWTAQQTISGAALLVNNATATIQNLSIVNATTTNLLVTASTTLYNATTTSLAVFNIASTTNLVASTGATTTNIYIPGQTRIASLTGLALMTTGVISAYPGNSCTNQFARSDTASGVWTCGTVANADLANSTISGVALGQTLATLTATDGTLTFSGSYTGATAQTVGLNLGNGNTWTAQQTINAALLVNNSTSTIQNLSLINATSTNLLVTASTTLTNATTTSLYINSGFMANGATSTIVNLSFTYATSTGYILVNAATSTITNLTIVNATSTQLRIGNGTVGFPAIANSTNLTTGMYWAATDNLLFGTAGVERLRIGSGGRIGVGTTSPAVPGFNVQGDTFVSGKIITGDIFATGTLAIGTTTAAVYSAELMIQATSSNPNPLVLYASSTGAVTETYEQAGYRLYGSSTPLETAGGCATPGATTTGNTEVFTQTFGAGITMPCTWVFQQPIKGSVIACQGQNITTIKLSSCSASTTGATYSQLTPTGGDRIVIHIYAFR
jgi:hypothetical protein